MSLECFPTAIKTHSVKITIFCHLGFTPKKVTHFILIPLPKPEQIISGFQKAQPEMLLTLTSLLSLLGWVTATRAQVEGNNIHKKIKGRVSMHQNTHILIIIITSVRNKELDVFVLMLGRHWRRGWRKNKTITTTIDHRKVQHVKNIAKKIWSGSYLVAFIHLLS